jgi:arylsulfatase
LYTRRPEGRAQRDYAPGKFYSTDAITDYALDFISEARGKPFFLYLAYNAPHFPLHAPPAEIAKYARVYEQGWDKIRDARYARQKQLGLLDERWPLTPRSVIPPNVVANLHGWSNKANPAWDSLPAERRTDLARRMAVFAAMVDRMDQNIGRVMAHLEKQGQLDNTLIFFLSDNGACAEWDPFGFDVLTKVNQVNLGTTSGENVLHTGAALEAIGAPGSYVSYGSGWANAGNTPFRLYKHYSHEGGIATPLIVHWPGGNLVGRAVPSAPSGDQRRSGVGTLRPTTNGMVCSRVGHIIDLMPTCIAVADATYPREALPLEGRSLLQPAELRTICFEHEGNRAVRNDRWKLVSLAGQPWELYDMETDRVELHDRASKEPERVRELAAQWDAWASRMRAAGHWDPKNKPTKPKPGTIHD